MDIFASDNYKTSILNRVKDLRPRKKSLTLKKLSEVVEVQYTYFSKVMNSSNLHLSEDALFILCKYLEFFPDEIEFILLQRSYEVSSQPERKSALLLKLNKFKEERNLNAPIKGIPTSTSFLKEMEYLFNPLAVLVHVGLNCKNLREDPRQFCSKLGITVQQLKEILKILERNDLIHLAPTNSLEVIDVIQKRSHFSKEHPLTRIHQNLLKMELQQRLQKTAENDKLSFLATFTMDEPGFKKLKAEFQFFLKNAEKIAAQSTNQEVYQLNFDLFRWV